jgi:IS1 family transposase
VANVLSREKRLEVLAALVNGSSIRATSRMTDVHQDTIGRFGFAMGIGCERLHDRLVQGLACPLVDMDEQHSFCSKRQHNVPEGAPETIGEQWTWAALCRTSKLTIAWTVGKRDQAHADALVADVRARLVVMPQITTDGLALYAAPIAVNFGLAVPYVQTVKNYAEKGSRKGDGEKFAPKRGVDFIQKRVIYGSPDLDKATTYAIERSNATNRAWNSRLHRRTLAYSKLLDRHKASMALQFTYRNLCWIQRNMRCTAGMMAGVTDHVWELGELLDVVLAETEGEKPTPKPLTIPRPEGTTRELPAGRGWLTVLDGGKGSPSPSPAPTPSPEPVAMAAPVVAPAATPAAEPKGQLDLFGWTPRPMAPAVAPKPVGQLSLFGDGLEPRGGDPTR